MEFTGRVVAMQGGGMGAAIAQAFARRGAKVVIGDIDEAAVRNVAAEICKGGSEALGIRLDICDLADARSFVAAAVDRFGRLDGLVNNAGWQRQEPFLDNDEATWTRTLDVNLRGPINCCRAAAEHMIERAGGGRIVNIASDAGRVGSSGDVVYSAAKAGVIGLTKALARELAMHRINVNCVCPGPTDTPLFQAAAERQPKLVDSLTRAIPWKRVGTPQDIANLVMFLTSDAADYLTGQTVSVSGGLTMV